MQYKATEVKEAEATMDSERGLAAPPDSKLIKALTDGTIQDTSLTLEHVQRATAPLSVLMSLESFLRIPGGLGFLNLALRVLGFRVGIRAHECRERAEITLVEPICVGGEGILYSTVVKGRS